MGVIEHACFRANPRYALVLLDRVSSAERQLIGLDGGAGLYGVLRPRPGSGLEIRGVSADTALLFLTMAEPGPLPNYVVTQLSGETERTIGRLVLDGVLEIKHGGGYLSGAEAGDLLMLPRSDAGRGRIGELSRAALRYGQELLGLEEPLLARRLYSYGNYPIAAGLRQRLSDGAALGAYLGLESSGSQRDPLDSDWYEIVPTEGDERRYWRMWSPRVSMHQGTNRIGPSYKLYVSPAMGELKAAIRTVAASLAAVPGVLAFKVGFNVAAICRSDKLIVYFDRLDDLLAGAGLLIERLGRCPAHGVPFTAEITRDGLLSWGADPPAGSSTNWTEGTSWRMWVTRRLAEYLIAAGSADRSELEPWQRALQRLRLSGIDTDTWVPTSGMWAEILALS